jgi:hypothetical protein
MRFSGNAGKPHRRLNRSYDLSNLNANHFFLFEGLTDLAASGTNGSAPLAV